jgi:hypothetical protein
VVWNFVYKHFGYKDNYDKINHIVKTLGFHRRICIQKFVIRKEYLDEKE